MTEPANNSGTPSYDPTCNPAYTLAQKAFAECLGTAMLLCAVIGSGIMAERLSSGNHGVALLANTLVTVFALFVLIEVLGPISGAHFNPLVTLFFIRKQPLTQVNTAQAAMVFIVSQLLGAVLGAWLANAMFDMTVWQTSTKLRGGWGQWLAEAVATAGLIFVIARAGAYHLHAHVRTHAQGAHSTPAKASVLVACYIGAAYWFTASTSFANPAAVLGRMLSDSFAGVAPASAPGFVAAQCVGAAVGFAASKLLVARSAY
jgi:glycerol uptake facilitator-like aquaporin